MRKLALVLAVAASPVAAGQPISESLVECAALLDSSNRWFPERQSTPKGQGLRAASDALLAEACIAAEQEGRHDVDGYLDEVWLTKQNRWDDRGMLYLLTSDGKEWFRYCSKLAKHRGLDLKAAATGH